MRLIAGDIGGTSSRFAVVEGEAPAEGRILQAADFDNASFDGFEGVLARFLDEASIEPAGIDALCLALAGPVAGDRVRLTNLPWTITAEAIAERFAFRRVRLINDFEAAALGALTVPAERMTTLHPAPGREQGKRLVIGAGTGLGTAYLHYQHGRYRAFSTEAGHGGFAPADRQQLRLYEFLAARHGHVSYERVLSGGGLVELYRFCSIGEAPPEITPAQVTLRAARGDDPAARDALHLFARLYGDYAGNMAVTFKPEGGIYLVGGITVKTASWIESGGFRAAFLNRGRMEELVGNYPVYLVNEERVGLLGAARYALTEIQNDV